MEEGPIDTPKRPEDVKQEPGALPSGFVWCLIDIKNEEQVSLLDQHKFQPRVVYEVKQEG